MRQAKERERVNTMATLTKARKAELKANALEQLTALDIKQGETIWTTTDYVGNVGTAYVRAFIMRENQPVNITWAIAHATGLTLKEREGRWVIHTGGYGYSRSQYVTDHLSWVLFNEGLKLKDREL